MKYCPKCCKNKDESEFFKCRSYKDGLYYICVEEIVNNIKESLK